MFNFQNFCLGNKCHIASQTTDTKRNRHTDTQTAAGLRTLEVLPHKVANADFIRICPGDELDVTIKWGLRGFRV
jgi:hypothetical protein